MFALSLGSEGAMSRDSSSVSAALCFVSAVNELFFFYLFIFEDVFMKHSAPAGRLP